MSNRHLGSWARRYKTFFMLNSAEYKILNTDKYKNIIGFGFFSDSDKPKMLFFLFINDKCQKLLAF